MKQTTRFAPSPTGLLHLGHAYAALFAEARARETGGRFLLRIEDIDGGRCRPEFVGAIFEDLRWLGLQWEEPVRYQSRCMETYSEALGTLTRAGLVYPCFCTRRDIQNEIENAGHAPHGPDGPLYPGTCRDLDAQERGRRIGEGRPYALRLDVAQAMAFARGRHPEPLTWHDAHAGEVTCTPEILGDVVLARKDTPTSYHLAVTLDDHLQGVNLVTRGADLFLATHVHRLLQELLGLNVPAYHHHPLLTNPEGTRFAKRDNALTLRALREAGKSPDEVRRMAGH